MALVLTLLLVAGVDPPGAPGVGPSPSTAAVPDDDGSVAADSSLADERSAADVVRRIAGADRTATAAGVADDAWPAADTVVLVDGHDDVAALVGAHLAARLDVPVLLGGATLTEVTRQAIARLGPQRIIVLGSVRTDGLADGGAEVQHVSGDTPATLAAEALRQHPGTPSMPVVLVSAATSADALAAANLSPVRLLITAAEELSPPAADAIARIAPDEVVLLGGTAAIALGVEEEVRRLGSSVRRVAGATRYDTAVAATRPGAGTVVVASGRTAADAVAFVPWTARRGAALVLTPHDELSSSTVEHLRGAGHADAVIAGGTVAVGTYVDRQLQSLLTGEPPPDVVRAVRPLTADESAAMTGVSWREGCPVGLEELRVIELSHWDLTGNVGDDGLLVVHTDVTADVADVVRALFDARFPLHRVRPVDEHGGDDDASMAAGNSSAFNCRYVGGTTTWSAHAYGTAIDLNPVQNPYVRGSVVEPEAGEEYLDRTDLRPGMIVRPGPVTDAFAAIGWGWGADFTTSDDYQHFSESGR